MVDPEINKFLDNITDIFFAKISVLFICQE